MGLTGLDEQVGEGIDGVFDGFAVAAAHEDHTGGLPRNAGIENQIVAAFHASATDGQATEGVGL